MILFYKQYVFTHNTFSSRDIFQRFLGSNQAYCRMSARGMRILEIYLFGIMMIRVQYHLELAAPLSKPHHTQIWPLSGQKGGSKRVTKSECAEKSTLVASHSFEHVTPFVRTRYSAFSCFLDKEGKGKVECLVLIKI